MTQIEPKRIDSILQNRLNASHDLWQKHEVDNIEQEKVLLFKFYFDFSTAIECCLRGIVFEYAKNGETGAIIKGYIKPDSDTESFLPNKDKMKSIITEEYYSLLNKCGFDNHFGNIIRFLPISSVELQKNRMCSYSSMYDLFVEKYKSIRETRNKLAHGIRLMDEGTFTTDHLVDFCVVYVCVNEIYTAVFAED